MSASDSSKSKISKFSLTRLGGRRLREHDVAQLDVPAQHHLGRRLAVAARRFGDHRVVEHAALGDRRPRLGGDPVLGVEGPQLVLGEVGVHLDLVDRRDRPSVSSCSRRRWCGLEVGHPDRPGPAVGVDPLQRLPGLDEVADLRQRPVDQEQVDVVQPQVGQRLVERLERVVVVVEAVVQLAGDEDLGRVEIGLARWPARPPSRCRTSRPCRCAGSRPRARSVTAAAVSAGLIWKTPKPSWGISTPLFSVMFGTVVIAASVIELLFRHDGRARPSHRPCCRCGAAAHGDQCPAAAIANPPRTGRSVRRTARRWCAGRSRRPRVRPRNTAGARRPAGRSSRTAAFARPDRTVRRPGRNRPAWRRRRSRSARTSSPRRTPGRRSWRSICRRIPRRW